MAEEIGTLVGDADSREAFAVSPTDTRMSGGMYRNQFRLPHPRESTFSSAWGSTVR
jgi:hypothetical protein